MSLARYPLMLFGILAANAATLRAQVRPAMAPRVATVPARVAVPRSYTPTEFRARFRALPYSAALLANTSTVSGSAAQLTDLPTTASSSSGLSAVGGTVSVTVPHMTASQSGWSAEIILSGDVDVFPAPDGAPTVWLHPAATVRVGLDHPSGTSGPVLYAVMLDFAGGTPGDVTSQFGGCTAAQMRASIVNGIATCALMASDPHPQFTFPIVYAGSGGSTVQLVDVTVMRVR